MAIWNKHRRKHAITILTIMDNASYVHWNMWDENVFIYQKHQIPVATDNDFYPCMKYTYGTLPQLINTKYAKRNLCRSEAGMA